MNIKAISEVLDMEIPDQAKRSIILRVISEDEKALPDLIALLEIERERNKELILEMNMQLSRADTFIENPKIADIKFIQSEIKIFYETHSNQVSHCYKQTKQK